MMAPGFKPVGWVAAVAGSAICCYMLSLNVASERAELLRIEHKIVEAKQDIRALQTELGTRGRLAQLEQWNADVLALSAPTTSQFLDTEVKLARFDQPAPARTDGAEVRMAAAEAVPQPARPVVTPVAAPVAAAPVAAPVVAAAIQDAPARPRNPLLHRASLTVPAAKPVKSAPAEPASRPAKVAVVEKPVARPVTAKASEPVAVAAKPAAPAKAPRIDASLSQQIAVAARIESARRDR